MYSALLKSIAQLPVYHIDKARRALLQPIISFIQQKVNNREPININFICTHNSRRSHFAQVWAQVAAAYYTIPQVACYSGGTEATALHPQVAGTLAAQGFRVFNLTAADNPVYAIKYCDEAVPIIGFSKVYDHPFNPTTAYAAIMTCSQADNDCPLITGAEKRLPLIYEDPKIVDGTPRQEQVYTERSVQIATELFYIFSMISNTPWSQD